MYCIDFRFPELLPHNNLHHHDKIKQGARSSEILSSWIFRHEPLEVNCHMHCTWMNWKILIKLFTLLIYIFKRWRAQVDSVISTRIPSLFCSNWMPMQNVNSGWWVRTRPKHPKAWHWKEPGLKFWHSAWQHAWTLSSSLTSTSCSSWVLGSSVFRSRGCLNTFDQKENKWQAKQK